MAEGRNAPCPCGSGRKFKKCCGRPGRQKAPPPPDSGERSLARKVAGSHRLVSEQVLDFGVDPYDPVVLELAALARRGAGMQSLKDLFARGLRRHADARARARTAALLEGLPRLSSEDRELVRLSCVALENPLMPPAAVGALELLYRKHLGTQVVALDTARKAEAAALERSLAEATVTARKARSEQAFSALVVLLSERGAGALPYLEPLLLPEGPGPESLAALALVASLPGQRALNLLVEVRARCEEPRSREALDSALGAREEAPQALLYALRQPHRPPAQRLALGEALVRLRAEEVLPSLLADLLGTGPWAEPPAPETLARRAGLVEALGDPRAFGSLLFAAEHLSGPVKDALAALWGERWSAALASRDGEVRVLVEDPAYRAVPVNTQAARWTRVERFEQPAGAVLEAGPEAWYERLQWLRPADIAARSEAEEALSARFTQLRAQRPPSDERAALDLERMWLWTATDEGEPPAVLWLRERCRFPGGFAATQRREARADWLREARGLEVERPALASRIYRALLAVFPGEPFALRGLARLGG